MKRLFVTLALVVTCFAATAQTMNEKEMIEAIARMQAKYPHITLCDIYKSFFQDYFGPGHIINSRKDAENYLLRELEHTEDLSVDIETTGAWGNFVRVDIYYIKNGKLNMDFYVDCLMRSVVKVDDIMKEMWLENWNLMQEVIESNGIKIDNYEDDRIFINKRIKEGILEMNHSRLFNELYHPHYRIIRREIFEKEIKPLIK